MQEQSSSFSSVLLTHFYPDQVPEEIQSLLQSQISSPEMREVKLNELYSYLEKELGDNTENNPKQAQIESSWVQYLFLLMGECKEKWENKQYPEILKQLKQYWFLLKNVQNIKALASKESSPFLEKFCEFISQAPLPEPKPTKANLCTALIKYGQTYYCCSTCTSSMSFRKDIRFCKKCWNLQYHIDHSYSEMDNSASEPLNCFCGREQMTKKEGFCSDHISETIQVEIQPEATKVFLSQYSVYTNLWCMLSDNIMKGKEDCAFRMMEDRCRKSLEKLVSGSAYYSNLFIKLVDQPCIPLQNETLFDALIEKQTWEHTFTGVLGTIQNQLFLAKRFSQIKYKDRLQKFQILKKRVHEGSKVLFELAKEKTYIYTNLREYLAIAAFSEAGGRLMQEFILQMSILDDQQYFQFLSVFIEQRDHPMSPLSELSLSSILRKVFSYIQKQKEKIKAKEVFQQKYKNVYFLGIKTICSLAKGRNQISQNMLQFLQEKGFQACSIFNFIYTSLKIIRQILFIKDKLLSSGFIMLLLMIEKSQERNFYQERIWTQLTKKDFSIEVVLQLIYVIICKISSFNVLQSQISLSAEIEPQKIAENKIRLQKQFCSFLYEKKSIGVREIWKLKRENALSFKNSGVLLNRLCTFNEETEKYEYCSNQKYPNPLIKFPLPFLFNRIRRLIPKTKNIFCSQKINLEENPLEKKLFQFLFLSKIFKLKFLDFWKDQIDVQKQKQNGVYYIFLSIIINQLCSHQIEQISEELKLLRQDGYTKYNTSGYQDKISKMLQIERENQNEEKFLGQKNPIRRQKPSKRKIEEVQTGQNQQIKDYEKKCIICKKIERDEGQFAFISNIKTQNTFSSIIFGSQNVSKTLISSCSHTIHTECFNKIGYDRGRYDCPQCNQECNIIIPTKIKQENKHKLKICSNILITTLIFEFHYFNFENMFTLLIKHLIQANGFYSFFNRDQEKQEKINKLMMEIASQIYQQSHGQEREQYDQFGENILEEIKQCKKMQSYLQLIVFKAIWSKVKKGKAEVDLEILQYLRENVGNHDFEIVKKKLQLIKEDQIILEKQVFQHDKPKYSFSLKHIQLPQIPQKLHSFIDKKCSCDNKHIYRLCLLCGEVECEKCSNKSNHPEKQHMKSQFFFDFKGGNIYMNKKGGIHKSFSIYRNDFWMPYHRRGSTEEGETFTLQQSCLDRAYQQFIQMFE